MATGYEDIDNLNNQVNQLYDQQMEQQKNIVNTSTQQAIDELERNKQKTEEQTLKTNKALYTDYQKQINPYGVNAENLVAQGLGKSGLAETTKANYYNTYQNARTEAQNNANTIKADFDAKIAMARQNGDLQMAQSALNLYQQKINDLYNMYNLRFNQNQFNYQKEQDALKQSNWEKEYQQALQQAQWQQAFNQAQFDYQKEQDALAQSNWEKEYELSKKAKSSGGSGGGSSGGTVGNVIELDNGTPENTINPHVAELETRLAATNAMSTILNQKSTGKTTSRDLLANAYNNGNISKDELIALTKKYKLN